MSRALGPNASAAPGGAAAGWAVLIACWAVVALSGLIWAAAAMAALVMGGTTEPLGTKFAGDLLHGRTQQAWPHTPTIAVGDRHGDPRRECGGARCRCRPRVSGCGRRRETRWPRWPATRGCAR